MYNFYVLLGPGEQDVLFDVLQRLLGAGCSLLYMLLCAWDAACVHSEFCGGGCIVWRVLKGLAKRMYFLRGVVRIDSCVARSIQRKHSLIQRPG